ncbi:MAG: hypothetical protein ACOYD4_15020 [Solirubrobacterales bacterium]
MSEYTKALADLVALPGRLDRQLASSEREITAERKRRERQIESYVGEHEAVLARLEATLERARGEGIGSGERAEGERQVKLGADPLEQAAQLVGRLDEALNEALYTRAALEAEEAALSEAERKRAAEERRRREREELRRGEAWERARQGTTALTLALGAAAAAGLIGGAISAAAVVAVAVMVALGCFGLLATVTSTLPALAVRRATGSMPTSLSAPSRTARLAAGGYVAAALGATGLGALLTGLATGAGGAAIVVALVLAAVGVIVTVSIWLMLPRAK